MIKIEGVRSCICHLVAYIIQNFLVCLISTYESGCNPSWLSCGLVVDLAVPGARLNSEPSTSLSSEGSFHWFRRDCWLLLEL